MSTNKTKENRGGKRENSGRKKIANPLSKLIAFRLLPEDKASFIEAAGGKEHLKNFVLNACYEAVRLKGIRGF